MNDLEKYFNSNEKRLIHKFNHYFDIYDRHFSRFRGTNVTILEIGVFKGGSLQMWKDYFGEKARIIGVDINPDCKEYEEDQIEVLIGSQTDRKFLRSIKEKIPRIDILIDDGGHTMLQQIITFEELYDHVDENGVYLCEDLHTSYFLEYGGGHRRRGTFIEFSKKLVDKLNAYHSEQHSLKPDEFTMTTHSIHFYMSILVIEKGRNERPVSRKTGGEIKESVDEISRGKGWKYFILKGINKALRFMKLPGFRWR